MQRGDRIPVWDSGKVPVGEPLHVRPLEGERRGVCCEAGGAKSGKTRKGVHHAAEDGAPMLLHTSWSDRKIGPNTGRYSSPLGKWPAADCARRLERPRVPRGSHRGTTSPAIAYLSLRGQLLAGMRALAPTRPRAHPRLRDRAWRTERRDCVLWCSIWCRAAIALLNARAPLTGLASVHLLSNL